MHPGDASNAESSILIERNDIEDQRFECHTTIRESRMKRKVIPCRFGRRRFKSARST